MWNIFGISRECAHKAAVSQPDFIVNVGDNFYWGGRTNIWMCNPLLKPVGGKQDDSKCNVLCMRVDRPLFWSEKTTVERRKALAQESPRSEIDICHTQEDSIRG